MCAQVLSQGRSEVSPNNNARGYLCYMIRIGLISDTHGYLDPSALRHFDECDEIWHAGDFGSMGVAEELQNFKPLRGVYGNIDGTDIRAAFPETLIFDCEKVKVLMTHIGGYPGRYHSAVKKQLELHRPQLFISGHSHILKIQFDEKLQCLHINPGAAGRQGWHKVRTIVLFDIEETLIKNCRVIELGSRQK